MKQTYFDRRLDFEQAIMMSEMPQFWFYRYGETFCFKGWQHTTTLNRSYELELTLTKRYPDEKPRLYVTSPIILNAHDGRRTINQNGTAHSTHTLPNGPNGCVQICLFSSARWDASKTCVGVFTKGILWLEAYETHLQTGNSIARILDNWRRRQRDV